MNKKVSRFNVDGNNVCTSKNKNYLSNALNWIFFCSRRGQRRQGGGKISPVQDHLHPSEGASCPAGLVWCGVLDVYLLTPPPSYLCCSVLCVWGGAGGAGHVRRSVNIPSPSLHLSFWWSLSVKRCVERLFLAPPRCDHRWMGVLPSSSRRWHHQSGAARILPGQFPGSVTHTDSGVELNLRVFWDICQKEQLFYLFSILSLQ